MEQEANAFLDRMHAVQALATTHKALRAAMQLIVDEVVDAYDLRPNPITPANPPALTYATQIEVIPPPQSESPAPSLASHPLAGYALDFVPYEYRQLASNALHTLGHSRRALALAIVVAAAGGIYTGHIAIPKAVRETIAGACPIPTPIPIPTDLTKG